MTKTQSWIITTCAAFALISLGVFSWAGFDAARSLRLRVDSNDVTGIIANVTVATRHANTSLSAADDLIKAAAKATGETLTTQKAMATSAGATTDLIKHVDASLNCAAINATDCPRVGAIVALANQVQSNGEKSAAAIDDMKRVIALLNDEKKGVGPMITEGRDALHSMQNLTDSDDVKRLLKTSADATQHLSGIAEHGENVAAFAEKKLTTPKPRSQQAFSWMYIVMKFASLAF